MLIEAGALQEGASLYDPSNIILLQHLISGLRAHILFKKNVDYIVTNDEVVVPQWSHLNCVTTFGFRFFIEDVLI